MVKHIFNKSIGIQNARGLFLILVAIHIGLLGYLASRHSPTQDEVAHLPAGLAIWRHGDFSVYRVNPPLVRIVAATPLLLLDHQEDWSHYRTGLSFRQEWALGRSFIRANGSDSIWIFTLARWCCIPFSLLGMWVCYRWGTELFSAQTGLLAAAMWCFSPNVLGHGSLITPDIAATSMGLLAAWRFSIWLDNNSPTNAFYAGVALGLALLTKTYWVTLLVLWPAMGLLALFWKSKQRRVLKPLLSLAGILLLGLNILNLGYLFQGTGTQLKSFDFYSSSLSGELRIPGKNLPGNRYEETWLGEFPVPFPKDYVTGIDLQKIDFEQGKWSYFFGEVKDPGGWWQYYLVGLFLKVPLGTWFLFLLGTLSLSDPAIRSQARKLLPLILPAILVLVIASSQTMMNRHVRYVFALLPVIYLLGALAIHRWRKLSILCLGLTLISSCLVYPHSLSFFNASIGGPNQGSQYLIDSNLDWGQDLLEVKEWVAENPEKRPLFIGWGGDISVRNLGLEADLVSSRTLQPGWYFISRSERYNPNQRLKFFEALQPVDQIGYTFDVYQLKEKTNNPALR